MYFLNNADFGYKSWQIRGKCLLNNVQIYAFGRQKGNNNQYI